MATRVDGCKSRRNEPASLCIRDATRRRRCVHERALQQGGGCMSTYACLSAPGALAHLVHLQHPRDREARHLQCDRDGPRDAEVVVIAREYHERRRHGGVGRPCRHAGIRSTEPRVIARARRGASRPVDQRTKTRALEYAIRVPLARCSRMCGGGGGGGQRSSAIGVCSIRWTQSPTQVR